MDRMEDDAAPFWCLVLEGWVYKHLQPLVYFFPSHTLDSVV